VILSLLLSLSAFASTAHVVVTRSYFEIHGDQASLRSEVVCDRTVAVPVWNFGEHGDPVEVRCESVYRDLPVPLVVSGLVQLVHARDFGLPMDPARELKRVYFSLDVGVGTDFPYLREVQLITGWQRFGDVTSKLDIFALSPSEFLEVDCVDGGCKLLGPQSIYRAQVVLDDAATRLLTGN
jgi:hypothetical protein